MFLAALVLQAATPQTAVDAERAFAAAAQARGQWTAFREYAAADATMFVPQPVKAQEWLKDKRDPVKSVEWWPVESWVSCDGKLAVNTGGSRWPSGAVGYFTTVWQRQPDGSWKWIVDHGDGLKAERIRPAAPKVHVASCKGKPGSVANEAPDPGQLEGVGASGDGSLQWGWTVFPNGARMVAAHLWNGRDFDRVLVDSIGAAK